MNTDTLFKTELTETQKTNSELNHREFIEGKTIMKTYPRRIVFELTNRCNFRCIMCGREAREFQTYDLPVSIIKTFESCLPHVEEVTLHGWGEGTLHPDFRGILRYLNDVPHLRKYFVTNGSTLPKILQDIFDYKVDVIAMSLDGASSMTNDAIRRGGNFARQTMELGRLIEEKKKLNVTYPYINFVFTAMKRNIHELPDMIMLADNLGIPEVKVVYLTVFNRELLHETLLGRQQEVREVFEQARRLAEKLHIKLKLPDVQGESKAGNYRHKKCAQPWRDLFIGSDGFIRPCQSSSLKLGHVSEYESCEDIWNSEQMQMLRRSVNDEHAMPRQCYYCYHSSYANWNLGHSFLQLEQDFSPEWGQKAEIV